jgi:sRNA-binding carbon storage regulator CsrA
MALVLTVRLDESVYVQDEKYTLVQIASEDKVRLRRARDNVLFEVTIFEKTELNDDAVVQLGDRITTKVARLAIEAPRSTVILSEEKYGKPKPRQN